MNDAVARCGELWFFCGPAVDMTQPGYWIASFMQAVVVYWTGYRHGKSDRVDRDEAA